MSVCVYAITCSVTGKQYVGQTCKPLRSRLSGHISDANRRSERSKLWGAIRKYGRENFSIELLETCETRERANVREIHWIETLDTIQSGYNIARGGKASSWTAEQRKNFSDTHPLRGVTGERHPAFGYRHTDEAKAAISKASRKRTGRIFSEEHRSRISTSQAGRTWADKVGEERAVELSEQASERMKIRHAKNRPPDSVVECAICGYKFTKTAIQMKRSRDVHCCSKRCVGVYSARTRST